MTDTAGTICIIDDDEIVLQAIAASVATLPYVVEKFSAPAPCIRKLMQDRCHLLISDVNMPELNGIDLVKRAREIQPLVPVIVMTGFADIQLAVRAVQAGANQFVEKPFDEDHFLHLVQTTVASAEGEDALFGSALTESERHVLRLVAEGKANKEIAYELGKSIRTIENQRHRLCRKLNLDSTADMVKLAVKLGLASLQNTE